MPKPKKPIKAFRHKSEKRALRGIEADFGPPAVAGPNTFRRDLHPDLENCECQSANGEWALNSSTFEIRQSNFV